MKILLLLSLLFSSGKVQSNIGGIAPDIVKRAHMYHGILVSHCDIYGYRYFYRNGKKCRLFTKSFLKGE